MKNFIIHLSSIPASVETATKLKNDLEGFGAGVELFEGIRGDDAIKICKKEGRTLYPVTLKGQQLSDAQIKQQGAGQPGVKGCFLSHFSLWQKCVELNEPIIIWEDDVIMYRAFEPIEWTDVLIVALGHPQKSPRWMHLLETPEGEPEAINYKSPSMPGCCGYAIKPHAAQKLIDKYCNTFMPADNAINRGVVKMEIHSYVMGVAKVEGKQSLTKTKAWSKKKKSAN
jgi:GR25 family glycosyltransferase involved in LPS biosynthesis